LGLTQALLEYKPDQISGFEFKLQPNADEQTVINQLQSIFHNKVTIKNTRAAQRQPL